MLSVSFFYRFDWAKHPEKISPFNSDRELTCLSVVLIAQCQESLSLTEHRYWSLSHNLINHPRPIPECSRDLITGQSFPSWFPQHSTGCAYHKMITVVQCHSLPWLNTAKLFHPLTSSNQGFFFTCGPPAWSISHIGLLDLATPYYFSTNNYQWFPSYRLLDGGILWT